MKEITVSCAGIQDRQQLHGLLKEALSFPDWYGANLDALHDLLGAIHEPTQLTLEDFSSLPPFAAAFRWVLNDAEEENPNFFVTLL